MKLIRRGILAVLLLIIIGIVIFLMRLDGLVKRTVETQATDSLKLKTTLDSAKVSLFGGKLDLNSLQVGSPPGFSAPQMFSLGGADVGVSYGQLRNDPVHVASVNLTKPRLVIEQINGQMNFKAAMDQMPKSDTPSQGKPPLKVIIDELNVNDPEVVVHPNLPGLPPEIMLHVPSIAMHNIGSGEGSSNGAAVKDVVMQVITAMAGSASQSGGLPAQLKGLLNLNLAQTVGQLGAEAQKRVAAAIPGELGQTLSEVVKDPQALVKDPGKALRGLGNLIPGQNKSGDATSQPAVDNAVNTLEGLIGKHKK